MDLFSILTLIGGLALFFVWYECNGRWPCEGFLWKAEKILENLTSNPIKQCFWEQE